MTSISGSAETPKWGNVTEASSPRQDTIKALQNIGIDKLGEIRKSMMASTDMHAKKEFLSDALMATNLMVGPGGFEKLPDAQKTQVGCLIMTMADVFVSIPPETERPGGSHRQDALLQMSLNGGGLRGDVKTMFLAEVATIPTTK